MTTHDLLRSIKKAMKLSPGYTDWTTMLVCIDAELAKPTYSRTYDCGCVLCICGDDERCHGCGAKKCMKPDAECVWMQKRMKQRLTAKPEGVLVPRSELEWMANKYDVRATSRDLAARLFEVSIAVKKLLAIKAEK